MALLLTVPSASASSPVASGWLAQVTSATSPTSSTTAMPRPTTTSRANTLATGSPTPGAQQSTSIRPQVTQTPPPPVGPTEATPIPAAEQPTPISGRLTEAPPPADGATGGTPSPTLGATRTLDASTANSSASLEIIPAPEEQLSLLWTSLGAPSPGGTLGALPDSLEPPAGSPSATPSETPTPSVTPTPTQESPTPLPIRYAGVPTASEQARWIDAATLWLAMPHRSQFDGSLYAQSNCGPASLGMILEAYGLKGYMTDALRHEANRLQGASDPGEGTALPTLAAVGQSAGLFPLGLFSRPGAYARWTVDDVRAHVTAGRPVIVLTRYADLPGNGDNEGDDNLNHYIVVSGLAGDQFIYNDSAYPSGRGAGLLISPDTLRRAWERSVIPGHAVAFARNSEGAGLFDALAEPAVEVEPIEVDAELEGSPMARVLAERVGLALETELTAADIDFTSGFVNHSVLYPKLSMSIPQPRADTTPRSPSPATQGVVVVALALLAPYFLGMVAAAIGQTRR